MPADTDGKGAFGSSGHRADGVVGGRTVGDVIRAYRYGFGDEDQLQETLATVLTAAGFSVEREVRLNARDRIDLLVSGRIGIEVKIAGSPERVVAQLRRYAEHDRIGELVLATRRAGHYAPASLNGKPVSVINLSSAGL